MSTCKGAVSYTHLDVYKRQILGDTIQQIAFEKAGIIKQGGTTVAYPQSDPAAVSVLKQAAKGRENRLYFADPSMVTCRSSSLSGSALEYRGLMLTLPFLGVHQIKNAATVLRAVEAVSYTHLL